MINYVDRKTIMKNFFVCSIFFCVFALSAFGELTPQDLEKIGDKIQESETRMRTHVTQEREKLDIKIQALDKLVDRNFYFLIGLMALIAVAIASPYRKDKKQDNLVQEVERLTKEMETPNF